MNIKNFTICENPIAKSKHKAAPRMVLSKDVIRFNTPAVQAVVDMGCARADIYIDVENKQIALVGSKEGGVKLQPTGVRMLRDMKKALNGVIEFASVKKERVTWGNDWGYSKHEYACTAVAEVDKKNKAIVFDLTKCEKLE